MDLLTTLHASTGPVRLDLDPDDIHAECARRGIDAVSDEHVFDLAARVISQPRRDPANSFILHAPLELLARRALLRHVPPDRRDAVRERMIWVAATYERAADPADAVATREFASPAAAVAALGAAITARDLDTVDAAAQWLAEHGSAPALLTLADAAVDSLAAAGHASIYFFHLSRTAISNRAALGLLRPLAREIARLPELRIEWIRAGVDAPAPDGARLMAALAQTPRLGLPGSDFVFPTVHQVDIEDRARNVIGDSLPSSFSDAANAILRVATHSMLQDDPAFAPYGWSHCLTLPQSVLGIARYLSNPVVATAIAATYVIAFRAAEGAHAIDPAWQPEPTRVALADALAADPATAASAVFHASDDAREAIVPALAGRAAVHEDAHLAKYTLACLDAAAADPAQRRLYLAAAASLGAWWANPA